MRVPAKSDNLRDLEEESGALRAMLSVLEDERATLVRGDTGPLEQLAERKMALAAELKRFAAQREHMLEVNGYGATRTGVTAWLRDEPSCAARWQALIGLARTAEELNRHNGNLVAMRLQNGRQALEALRSAAGDACVYGRDGQASFGSAARALGAA